jgi:hypothetical protein
MCNDASQLILCWSIPVECIRSHIQHHRKSDGPAILLDRVMVPHLTTKMYEKKLWEYGYEVPLCLWGFGIQFNFPEV